MSKPFRVLVLTKYGPLGASSRLRSLQYIPWLQGAGMHVTVQPLLTDKQLLARYHQGTYAPLQLLQSYALRCRALLQRHRFNLIWIERESLPWWPLWMEQGLLGNAPYVLEFDDAVFHTYDQHSNLFIRLTYGKRLDGLMAKAALVVGGNNYLAQRARDAGAPWVEVIPTVVDLERYSCKTNKRFAISNLVEPLKIVWIGTPGNVRYLQLIRAPLQALAKKYSFVLRLIGATEFDIPGVHVELQPWSAETEADLIRGSHIGIMPLDDSLWEKGKCGYKLIQYMACGLPVVASAVGVNSEIVQHGTNGYLATTPQEWEVLLGQLLESDALRVQLGIAGRKLVENNFCIQQTGPKLVALFQATIARTSVCAD
jgi:glycosyltransferase involved in cell wall biosynthesis